MFPLFHTHRYVLSRAVTADEAFYNYWQEVDLLLKVKNVNSTCNILLLNNSFFVNLNANVVVH